MDPRYPAPTEQEWATADVQVMLIGETQIIGLKKDLVMNGIAYSQTVWLTNLQLRSLAIDHVL